MKRKSQNERYTLRILCWLANASRANSNGLQVGEGGTAWEVRFASRATRMCALCNGGLGGMCSSGVHSHGQQLHTVHIVPG